MIQSANTIWAYVIEWEVIPLFDVVYCRLGYVHTPYDEYADARLGLLFLRKGVLLHARL